MKAYFAWKQLKVDYLKKFEKKKIAGTVLFVSWLATYQWKKIIDNFNSVGTGDHKAGISSSFLALILPIFGERKKSKLHILKKLGLSTFIKICI